MRGRTQEPFALKMLFLRGGALAWVWPGRERSKRSDKVFS